MWVLKLYKAWYFKNPCKKRLGIWTCNYPPTYHLGCRTGGCASSASPPASPLCSPPRAQGTKDCLLGHAWKYLARLGIGAYQGCSHDTEQQIEKAQAFSIAVLWIHRSTQAIWRWDVFGLTHEIRYRYSLSDSSPEWVISSKQQSENSIKWR